jgi:UTP--glucose-1-phosphate uridylyltransferase
LSVPVRKAVIPAAGLGTRFLPATKAQPKEMIPVIDTPGIQYTVEEAVRAGITDILVISSWGKGSLQDHFDRSIQLERHLEQAGKDEELAEIRRISELATLHTVRQKEPLGLGHAVLVGREHVGNEPFAVMVPDEIVPEPIGDEVPMLPRMIDVFERTGSAVIAVQEIPLEQISSYGSIAPEEVQDDLVRVVDMVEKPAPEDAPSNFGSRGRYVFPPKIFDIIERTEPGVGDEIQLTDAIKTLAQQENVYAYIHSGPMYDVGKKLDYLRATVELALRRDDLGKPFQEFLNELTARTDQ